MEFHSGISKVEEEKDASFTVLTGNVNIWENAPKYCDVPWSTVVFLIDMGKVLDGSWKTQIMILEITKSCS